MPICTVGPEEINKLNACIITGEQRLSKQALISLHRRALEDTK